MAVPPFLIPVAIRLASQYLPSLATKIVGDRAEKIAREVVEVAAVAAGKPGSTDLAEIEAGLASNPMSREEVMLRYEEMNLRYLEDMQDARRSQEVRGTERSTYMLVGVTVGLVACIATVLYLSTRTKLDGSPVPIDPGVLALVTTIAGALLKMFSDAFAFEFGSSRGSKEKDAQVTQFKQALMRVGEARNDVAKELIESQQAVIKETVGKAVGGSALALQAAGTVSEPPRSRDFVAELVNGQV